MAQEELLARVVHHLEASKIEYMLTGSIVSSLQGEPRSTHDIDVVVVLGEEAIPAFLNAFPSPQYYCDELMVRDAIARKSVFNLLEINAGDKVDFWLLTEEAFDRSRFARRRKEALFGFEGCISSPEDTILQKLKWSALSGVSQRQFKDAVSVYELQFRVLDMAYIIQWVERLGVQSLWKRLLEEAQPLA